MRSVRRRRRIGWRSSRAANPAPGCCLQPFGQAGPLLRAAIDGIEPLLAHFALLEQGLRLACFATGSANLAALRGARLLDEGWTASR